MKFLSKLARVALQITTGINLFGSQISTLYPSSGAVVGTIMDFSSKAAGIIAQTELMASALTAPVSGPEKLKMAAVPMAQAVLQSSAFAGRKIANPTLFQQGATKIADGFADCVNALDEDEVTKL